MNVFEDPDVPDDKNCLGENYVGPGKKDTQVQLVISLALGLSAFLAFCVGIWSCCSSFGFPFCPPSPAC
jgi:hypothetical protein